MRPMDSVGVQEGVLLRERNTTEKPHPPEELQKGKRSTGEGLTN